MVQPFRAIHTSLAPGEPRPCIVIDVVVIPGQDLGPNDGFSWPELRVIAVASDNGELLSDGVSYFRATEPSYLGQPEPGTPDHEHEFIGTARPILEGSRIVGYEFACTHPGCKDTQRRPAGAHVVAPS